ncbi:MAG: 1-acyl-sn-glycerol-3-phosphate acyltransferase [Actinomycetota bacterium]
MLFRRLATLALRLGRWTVQEDCVPPAPKSILTAAPHTSFVDGFWMLVAMRHYGVKIRFLMNAKHLRGPFGLLKYVGAVPVTPGKGGTTADLVKEAGTEEEFAIVISPPGTRSKQERWRSGFYHLAIETGLPIYFSYLDYGQRRVGIGTEPLIPSGDIVADMNVVREFYGGMLGRAPEQTSTIVLREELELGSAPDQA